MCEWTDEQINEKITEKGSWHMSQNFNFKSLRNSQNFLDYGLNMCYSCIIINYKIKFRDWCCNFQTTQNLSWDIKYFNQGQHNINSWSDL